MKGNFGPRLGVAFCAAVFALLRCASAQALIVGPGGFADLDSAYAAAQSGDLILVRQDTWFSRLDGKGVRILSDGATYRLDALYGTAPAGIVNLPAGESIELRDFNIVPVGNLVGGTGAAFRIENCAGSVVLMSCVIDGVLTSQVDAAPTFLVESCSRVSIYGGFFNGRNAKQSGVCTPRGTDGVRIENSTVGLYGAFFSGGAYASPYSNGCPNAPDGQGVSAQDSVVYCVDSGVSGGSSQGSGLDIMSLDSVFYGPTGGYVLEGGGIYYANGSPSPNVFGVNANVVLGSYRKPWMTATRSAVGATLDVYAQT
ncbi:MAG: hypothetical protein AB8H80_20265, partial [Planctomycetota bacterium]